MNLELHPLHPHKFKKIFNAEKGSETKVILQFKVKYNGYVYKHEFRLIMIRWYISGIV